MPSSVRKIPHQLSTAGSYRAGMLPTVDKKSLYKNEVDILAQSPRAFYGWSIARFCWLRGVFSHQHDVSNGK